MQRSAPLRGALFRSPLGTIVALAGGGALVRVDFDPGLLDDVEVAPEPALVAFEGWLEAYLSRRFDALPPLTLASGGTDGDQEVWGAVRRIPVGSFVTYAQLSARLKKPPTHARAIGAAVGRNPLALVVPCHRVLGQGGRFTGYAWGVSRKAWLLKHEGVLLL
jgi:methylated-DNA-[protein]-cysteine S-methyltransferase